MSRYVEPFTCDVTPETDHVVIAPRGELDMATVSAVEQEYRKLGRLVLEREFGHYYGLIG